MIMQIKFEIRILKSETRDTNIETRNQCHPKRSEGSNRVRFFPFAALRVRMTKRVGVPLVGTLEGCHGDSRAGRSART